MDFSKITAIIRPDKLEAVEKELLRLGVHGVSVLKGKGFGDHANFFSPDWTVMHVRVEVFTGSQRADEIATAIMNAAHTGIEGDGLVAIAPVETIYHIRTRQKCSEDVCE